jgi:hypothetical protein
MRIDKFWVVTDPTIPESEIGDILFETDAKGIFQQFKGGLDVVKDGVEFYTDRESAAADAMERLEWIQRKPRRSSRLLRRSVYD